MEARKSNQIYPITVRQDYEGEIDLLVMEILMQESPEKR